MNSIRLDAPLVSIIVNNYNYAKFLTTAIESALNQTYGNIEVIVVDDGSTDDSRAVIGAFGSRIKSVFQKNGGQGSAYNAGFAASKGELIHYLDADDILAPSAIAETVAQWEPKVSKLQFYLRVIKGKEGTLSQACIPSGQLESGDLLATLLRSGNYVSPPATGNVYSRSTLAQILPMPERNWPSHADLYCIFQSPFFGEIRALPLELGFYRVHGNNIDAQTEVSGKLLRYRLTKEEKRDALIGQCCARRGIAYNEGTVSKSLQNLKLRFASCLLEPHEHPYPTDTKYSTFTNSVIACWNEPASTAKRLLFSAWAAALVISPLSLRPKLLAYGFVPLSRPALINRFLSFAAKKGPR